MICRWQVVTGLHISNENGERWLAFGYTEKIMAKGVSMSILQRNSGKVISTGIVIKISIGYGIWEKEELRINSYFLFEQWKWWCWHQIRWECCGGIGFGLAEISTWQSAWVFIVYLKRVLCRWYMRLQFMSMIYGDKSEQTWHVTQKHICGMCSSKPWKRIGYQGVSINGEVKWKAENRTAGSSAL